MAASPLVSESTAFANRLMASQRELANKAILNQLGAIEICLYLHEHKMSELNRTAKTQLPLHVYRFFKTDVQRCNRPVHALHHILFTDLERMVDELNVGLFDTWHSLRTLYPNMDPFVYHYLFTNHRCEWCVGETPTPPIQAWL